MKLEDIEKKEIFKVPDGYFDALPSKIQNRIDAQNPKLESSFVFRYKLQYVLPVIIFLVIGIFWLEERNRPKDAENLIASIATEDLIAYLDQSEVDTDEVLDHIEFNSLDLEEIETEVYELQLDDGFLDGDFEELGIENI
jgi:hypothetical protein